MRSFFTIWRRELTACFLSPVAYVTMVVFVLLANWTFLEAVERNAGGAASVASLYFVSVFFWLPVLVTVITMRLFAEERRSGTLETLMTAPVDDGAVVWGKYAGAWTFLLITLVPTAAGVPLLAVLSPGIRTVDAGSLAVGGLMLALLSAFWVSIGLLVSLLTKNQIVAAICCFCVLCLPFLFQYLGPLAPPGSGRVLDYLSIETHIVEAARGVLDTRPLVLYGSGTLFMLFTSVRVLESRRWR